MDDAELEEMAQMPKDDYLTPGPPEQTSPDDATDGETDPDADADSESDAPSSYGAP